MILLAKHLYKRFKYAKNHTVSINICSEILGKIIKRMVDDIINHGTYIETPKSWGTSMFCMRKIEGNEFRERYRNGEFNDIDYIKTDYKAYKLSMKSNTFDEFIEFDVDDKTQSLITDKTNKGYRY